MITFAILRLLLPGNREESQVKGLESKFGKSYFIHTIPGQLPVKKILIPTFSSFAATDHKGDFRKVLTRIFVFGCFPWYHAYIFENNKLEFRMQNLIWHPFQIPKMKKQKARIPFSNFSFLF